jgi:hypothetical protein
VGHLSAAPQRLSDRVSPARSNGLRKERLRHRRYLIVISRESFLSTDARTNSGLQPITPSPLSRTAFTRMSVLANRWSC